MVVLYTYKVPFLDPEDYPSRYTRHLAREELLSPAGLLIAVLLVIWANTYGADEAGIETLAHRQDLDRRSPANAMVNEALKLIDHNSIMRQVTWDGVTALLILLPLTEGIYLFLRWYKAPDTRQKISCHLRIVR